MVICSHCGQANEPGTKFCRFCGHPLSDASVVESVPQRESSVGMRLKVFEAEMFITAIAWYMVVLAILYLLSGVFSMLSGMFGDYLMDELGLSLRGGRENIAILTIGGWVVLFVGIISGAAATGLFRARVWALGLAKVMLIVNAVLSFIVLLLIPNFSTAFGTFISVLIAVVVWVYLGQPYVRSYIDKGR